jgi:hypothetical protein
MKENSLAPDPAPRPVFAWLRPGDKLFDAGTDIHLNACIPIEHPEFECYCSGYRQAAEVVVEAVETGRAIPDSCIYAIVYLYRHYVELCLKEIILMGNRLQGGGVEFPVHHDLLALWEERKKVLANARLDMSGRDEQIAEGLIRELASVDPQSFTFRYPVDKKRKPAMPQSRLINVRILKETMERLGNFLDGEAMYISVALQDQPENDHF